MKRLGMVNLDVKLEGVAWMTLANPDKSLAEAIEDLKAKGNTILEVDEAGRRVKVMDVVDYPYKDVFACEKCGAYSIREAVAEAHERDCDGDGKVA